MIGGVIAVCAMVAQEAVSGSAFLDASGREIRIADIAAPQMSALDHDGGPAPGAERARDALQALLDAHAVSPTERSEDRWGRRVSVVRLTGEPDYAFLAEALVAAGRAYVDPQAESEAERLARLLDLEAEARAARLGLWGYPATGVRAAEPPARDLAGAFRIVRGQIRSVAEVRGRVYLNFGENYRRDFTISVTAADASRMGIEAEALDGAVVEARGFVRWTNGPMIEWRRAEQVRTVSAPVDPL